MKLRPLYMPGCPHRPTIKQWVALQQWHTRELLFGGGAGGGKSDFLLMAGLQCIDNPDYSGIIFRRTFPQLSAEGDGLMTRAQEWLSEDPRFEGVDAIRGIPTVWRFKGGGSLSFSHLQHEKSKYDHQGPRYQFIGWDELTQFTRGQYLYLLGRLGPKGGARYPVPLRMRAASNPGGEGHAWVLDRFPVPIGGKRRPKEGRAFIPSLLSDNPFLDGEEYRSSLRELPAFERAQLLDGDWEARRPGAYFDRARFPVFEECPPYVDSVRFWDFAATSDEETGDPDWTVGARMRKLAEPVGKVRFVLDDVRRGRKSPAGVEKMFVDTTRLDGRGVSSRMEQEPGSAGKTVVYQYRKALRESGIRVDFDGIRSTGSKYERAKVFIADHEREEIGIVRAAWNEPVLDALEGARFDDKTHEDDADACAGAYNALGAVVAPQVY